MDHWISMRMVWVSCRAGVYTRRGYWAFGVTHFSMELIEHGDIVC